MRDFAAMTAAIVPGDREENVKWRRGEKKKLADD